MKTKLYLFAFLSIMGLMAGCSSENNAQPQTSDATVIGSWHWVESKGGIAYTTHTPQSTGNQIALVISSTTVKKYTNGILTSEMPYTIQTLPSIYGGNKPMLVFESGGIEKQSFEITGNQLQLNDECYDCFSNKYTH